MGRFSYQNGKKARFWIPPSTNETVQWVSLRFWTIGLILWSGERHVNGVPFLSFSGSYRFLNYWPENLTNIPIDSYSNTTIITQFNSMGCPLGGKIWEESAPSDFFLNFGSWEVRILVILNLSDEHTIMKTNLSKKNFGTFFTDLCGPISELWPGMQ